MTLQVVQVRHAGQSARPGRGLGPDYRGGRPPTVCQLLERVGAITS